MSCQVMYQSHYSYFPYQRAASHPNTDTKQGIVDTADTDTAAAQADSGAAETAATSAATSPPQHYHSSYSRHAPYPHQHQDSFSPHHNNNHTFGGGGGGDTANNNAGAGARAGELPPLVRAGDKAGAGAGAGQLAVVKGEAEQGAEQRSAQYMSANCVIFTYYSGDISKMVDEHFTKALSQASDRDHVPLSARNLPPSFWDCNWVGSPALAPAPAPEYSGDPWAVGGAVGGADPWHNYMATAAQLQAQVTGGSYSAHHMYHNARSYSSLLLHSRREWVEQNYSSSPYSSMTGLDGGMQSSAKDLYWF